MASREQRISEIAERETSQYLHNRAMLHLEAAIGSLLDVHDPEGVASILRKQAEILEDWG